MASHANGITNGVNGHSAVVNGVPGPSRSPIIHSPATPAHNFGSVTQNAVVVNGHTEVQPEIVKTDFGSQNNADSLEHIYHNGFRQGHWADTVVHVQGHAYNMHALLLGRSPYLAHLMSTTPLLQSNGTGPMRSIYVPIEHEPEITVEAFTLAVGYLYSSVALAGITSQNARGVLATGCFLGGMDDLCQYAYGLCRSSICIDTIDDWLAFFARAGPRDEPGSGTATPTTPLSASFPGPFTSYIGQLREDFTHFLIVDLPHQFNAFAHDVNSHQQNKDTPPGLQALVEIYSRLPFDMFKRATESSAFAIGTDQARFRFAKSTIERRKVVGGIAHMGNAEETVVLAFGGQSGTGSSVHVTRKVKKRPLWKVSGN